MHITIVAGFSRGFFSQIPIVGKLFDLVVGGVRKQLTMVEIKGSFLKPETHAVPFKPFTKSIKNMFELLPKDEHGTTTTNTLERKEPGDRKSTRLNSSHSQISYSPFFF